MPKLTELRRNRQIHNHNGYFLITNRTGLQKPRTYRVASPPHIEEEKMKEEKRNEEEKISFHFILLHGEARLTIRGH